MVARLEAAGWVVLQRDPRGVGRSHDGSVQVAGPSQPDRTFTLVRTVAEVRDAAARGDALWLRGQEAGGLVRDTTVLVLLRAAADTGCRWVAEGLGPRGCAAALALGAAGVVFDGLLWGATDLPWPDAWRQRVARLTSPRQTRLVGLLGDEQARLLVDDPRQLAELERAPGQALAGADGDDAPLPCPAVAALAPEGPLVEVVRSLFAEVCARRDEALAHHPLRTDPLGTGRAVVQGPMANVAESAGLGRAVAAAGGLPFCALGALAPEQAAEVVARQGPHRFGVGVMGFEMLPHRDAHLACLAGRALPVILAGGSIALAQRLAEEGHEPWLHTPDPSLVRAALDAGLPAMVWEGHEAGGHVGPLPSTVLWEASLAEVESHTHRPLLVLAGGIGDEISAAFAGAMAARAHRMGAPVALQAGTAFFFTHEIVEEGQITLPYQEAALAADTTVLVGSSVDLPLRCAPSPFTDEARELEARLRDEGRPRRERRATLEHHNLGRTRIAAKGIERHPAWGRRADAPHYRAVPVERQHTEGAFTLGQGAAARHTLCTVAEVVEALSYGAAKRLEVGASPGAQVREVPIPSPPGPARPRPLRRVERAPDEPIAVVGMGCVLPGAPDIPSYWRQLLAGHDAVGPVPEARWSTGHYVGAEVDQSITYAAGAVRGFAFDPLSFRIPPRTVPAMDRAQQLALVAAREAASRAGWLRGGVDPRRAAVVLGNSMGGEHAKSLAVRIRYREVLDAVAADALTEGWHLDDLDGFRARVAHRLAQRLPPVDVESMAGLLGNVIAGRVASWLDWMGGNLTVDAACAASLAAVTVAVDWLRAGRCDAVLTGGVDADLSPETYVGFCRTHALSARGSAPFSSRADGFVMGEGAAVLALMRLGDAEAQGVPVWAVLHGLGQASDGRSKGITAPRGEAQELALQRAWAEAGCGPEQLGAIEAHGTGTSLGDLTEVTALQHQLGVEGPEVWVGSVKSGMGHLKGAAGAAGLARGVLTALTGVAPPTLHAGPVRPELPLGPRMRLPRQPVRLQAPLVGVSAFGFGGTNFHAVLGPPPEGLPRPAEIATPRVSAVPVAWQADDAPPLVLCFGADDDEALHAAVVADRPVAPDEAAAYPVRLALLADPDRRAAAVARAGAWLTTRGSAWSLGHEIAYGSGPARAVVALCPGQGSQRPGSLARARAWSGARQLLGELPAPDGTPLHAWEARATDDALAIHLALFAAELAWGRVLHDAGIAVAAWSGHSLGAFAALVGAGWLAPLDGLRLVEARGRALQACGPGGMLAVRGDVDTIEALAQATGLSVAAHNAPTSWAIAGAEAGLREAMARAPDAVRIDVPRAYHSPLVRPAVSALRPALADASFVEGAAVWSTRSGRQLAVDAVRDDLARAIAEPVRFAEAIADLQHTYDPLFVECGPGDVLTRLAQRQGAAAVALAGRHPHSEPFAAAALWAHGHPGLLAQLPGTLGRRGLRAPSQPQWARHDGTPTLVLAPASPARLAPPAAPTAAPDELTRLVTEAVCEVTGYPAAFLDDGTDLADLGVDSIRKMEVLGLLEKRLGIRAREADYADLADADIQALVAWVERRRLDEPEDEPAATAGGVGYAVPGPVREPASPLPHVLAAWLERHPDVAIPRVAEALARGAGRCEARAKGGVPQSPPLRRVTPRQALALPTPPVIVATGGASGIVGRCLIALAPARVLLLGRRTDPDLEPLREAGLEVCYAACDVVDAQAVARAVGERPSSWGPIDVVVHGAGTLRDGPLADASAADADAVLGPKLLGAHHLAQAVGEVGLWVDFSSVVAHVGNPAQALYAAANLGLEALPVPAARRLSLAWTAWEQVGMAADPALLRLLASRGVTALSPDQGARAFAELVASELEGPVLVWGSTPERVVPLLAPLDARHRWSPHQGAWSVDLEPDDEALAHHVVAGRPLVPAALWVAALWAAATDLHEGPWRLEELEVHAPTFVVAHRVARVVLEPPTDGAHRARIEVDGTLVASATLVPELHTVVAHPAGPRLQGDDAAPLYRPDLLFHGPTWQVLAQARTSPDDARAELHPANGQPRPAEVVDGIHQLLCAWSEAQQGFLALPVGAREWQQHAPFPSGALQLWASPAVEGTDVIASVQCLDEAGRLILSGEGIRLRRAGGGHA